MTVFELYIILLIMQNEQKEYLTVVEVAAILKKHGSTICRYIEDGHFPGAKKTGLGIRSPWRIPVEAVEAVKEKIFIEE